MVDFIAISVRALGFVAALQAAGVPLFLWLFGDDLPSSMGAIQRLGARVAIAGLLLTMAYQVLEPARLTGELVGVFDSSIQALLLASDLGTATAVRVLGLAMVVLVWLKPSRFGDAAALAGSALVVVSFAFTGHTAADDQRWLLAGLGMSALLLPSPTSLTTPYGLLFLAKVSGFALLMALASFNKWRLGPRMIHGDGHAAYAFRRSLAAEWVLIAAVLTVTAVMTALFSPTH